MALKKSEPIDTYRHEKTRIEVKIFLDRQTFTYFGTYCDRRYENKDHGELIKAIKGEIEANSGLHWEEVLHIGVQKREKEPSLSFTYERFLLCHRKSKGGDKLKGGDMLKCPWHVELQVRKPEEEIEALRAKSNFVRFQDEHNVIVYEGLEIPDDLKLQKAQEWRWDVDRNEPFKVPCRPKSWRGLDDEIYVAYDERVWTTLTILHARMDALADALKLFFLDETKLTELASGGIALLGLPGTLVPTKPREPKEEDET